ncbi:phosphatase PAP2 family protein [Paenibacillus sp. 5J-6]|uniref:Phosphatase PAP2 family protein n=1 Tax=Paenibacillus silvestris TaxID=2606219 RepID=A0A6L8V521_9BACL|nr:phosphatase PAP2 family protein [Paenibacillus silvestris]MZQ85395.1 phosphatase PAP2 family protein [Paenibacillus silvestris]
MNLKMQLTWAFFISLLSAISFGAIALLVTDHKVVQFDSEIISFIQDLETPSLTNIMKLFTFVGGGLPVVVVTVIILFFLYKVLHHRSELILFIGVVVGSVILNETLKLIFKRARPVLHRIIEANGFSFPSGHSMAAFSLYGVVAFLLWRHISTALGRSMLIVISIVMIIMIGISRIYLGVHYPSDVLGGFLASGSWLAISIWYYQRYQERRYEAKAI